MAAMGGRRGALWELGPGRGRSRLAEWVITVELLKVQLLHLAPAVYELLLSVAALPFVRLVPALRVRATGGRMLERGCHGCRLLH